MRSTSPASAGSTKKVSCMARAGWSGPKLRVSKLNHSLSTSGPSAISQPSPTKMSLTRSTMADTGWRAPRGCAGADDGEVPLLLGEHRPAAAASSASRAVKACATCPRPRPDPLAGLGLRRRGRAPISGSRARAGSLSPACARRAALSSSRVPAAAAAARASRTLPATASRSRALTSTGSYRVLGPDIAFTLWSVATRDRADRAHARGASPPVIRGGFVQGCGGGPGTREPVRRRSRERLRAT